MSSLEDTQALFWQTLQPGAAPLPAQDIGAHFRDHGPLAAPERLQIYTNMYLWRLVDSLREDFPVLVKLLGDRSFFQLCESYIARHPSQNCSIMRMGRHLSAYATLQRTGRPDAADLAALEWARGEVFEAADATPVNVQTLAELGENLAAARLQFVPALRQLTLAYDVVTLWRALEQAPEDDTSLTVPAPHPATTHVAVWRPEYEVLHTALEPEAAEALHRARSGAPIGEVCEAFAGLPQPVESAFAAMGAWFADGWIAAVEV